jgi:hypothetical protein
MYFSPIGDIYVSNVFSEKWFPAEAFLVESIYWYAYFVNTLTENMFVVGGIVNRKMHLQTLGTPEHNMNQWEVIFHDDFLPEYRELSVTVQNALIAATKILREKGPLLGRPYVDTLKGSSHPNMKELRFDADGGVWRVAFAFDPERNTIALVAGDKGGIAQRRFYGELINVADGRFDRHLSALRSQKRK